MAKSQKKRSTSPIFLFIFAIVVLALGAYIRTRTGTGPQPVSGVNDKRPTASEPTGGAPIADRPQAIVDDVGETPRAYATPPDRGAMPWLTDEPSPAPDPDRAANLLRAGADALQQGDLVAARAHLNDALLAGPPTQELASMWAELANLGDQTIFSNRILKDDPLADAYVIRAGDTLAKIAKDHHITADLLARINRIEDKNRIRLGQRIKVIHGPFHAIVTKSTFDLHVYLQSTFVRHFKVGLGLDGSTPGGEWICDNKLTDPTYYPPRGGKIRPAGHPENPLGHRWIGLKGVAGEAVGQQRYGIHGTTDSDSIGKAVSMGCIRLHNSDVDQLFDMVVTGRSHIVVRE